MNPTQRQFKTTGAWYPQLDGLGLPRPLTTGIDQAYKLIYSLRDAIQKTSDAGSLATAQIAYPTDDLVLSAAPTDIPGCTITLKNAGNHLITGIIGVEIINGAGQDAFAQMLGYAYFDGAPTQPHMEVRGVDQAWMQMQMQWIYKAPSSGIIVKLAAAKFAGTGISQTYFSTFISALWLGA